MNLVARVVCLAEYGIWDRHYLVVASVDADATHLVIHSHNLIICRVETNALSTRVAATGEQFLIHLLTYYAHLASLTNIHLIEKASVVHDGGSYVGIVIAHSRHVCRERVLALHGILLATEHHWGDNIEFGHLLAQTCHIFLYHREISSLAESLVCLGGILRPYHRRVGGESRKVLLQHLLESLSTANKYDEHKHSPEHSESSKKTATLVAGDRVDNLAVGIYVEFHLKLKN